MDQSIELVGATVILNRSVTLVFGSVYDRAARLFSFSEDVLEIHPNSVPLGKAIYYNGKRPLCRRA